MANGADSITSPSPTSITILLLIWAPCPYVFVQYCMVSSSIQAIVSSTHHQWKVKAQSWLSLIQQHLWLWVTYDLGNCTTSVSTLWRTAWRVSLSLCRSAQLEIHCQVNDWDVCNKVCFGLIIFIKSGRVVGAFKDVEINQLWEILSLFVLLAPGVVSTICLFGDFDPLISSLYYVSTLLYCTVHWIMWIWLDQNQPANYLVAHLAILCRSFQFSILEVKRFPMESEVIEFTAVALLFCLTRVM